MYLSHYNLKEKPFQISTDPKFIWLGENHREALAVLEYGVIDNKGFLLITGDVGTGKTTLVNALIVKLGHDSIVANITNPILNKLEFLNMVANEFGIDRHFASKGEFLIHFSRFLNHCYEKKKKVILIVDEAHKLSHELLEQIRLLSNIEKQETKLINIFFVGQNEFIDIISDQQRRALRQRIAINYHIEPLRESEVKAYIFHRLSVAGLNKKIFTENSIREIFSFSKGYPRLINIICDHALLTGYVKEVKIIDEDIIKECADGLFITGGKSDGRSKDPATVDEAASAAAGKPSTMPGAYADKSTLAEDRLDHGIGKTSGGGMAIRKVTEESAPKPSGKKFGYVAAALLLAAILGVLYYLNDLGGSLDNIKALVKSTPKEHQKVAPADIPQHAASTQSENPIAKGPDEGEAAAPQPADRFNEPGHSPATADKPLPAAAGVDIEPQKSTATADSAAAKALDQKIRPVAGEKLQEVPEGESFLTQKYTVNFKYDSYQLASKSLQTLERISALLAKHSTVSAIVKGYTDAYGNPGYNKTLSEQRANFVKIYFEKHGINAARIKTIGMGEKNPVASNKTTAGRRQNRRVEIELTIENANSV